MLSLGVVANSRATAALESAVTKSGGISGDIEKYSTHLRGISENFRKISSSKVEGFAPLADFDCGAITKKHCPHIQEPDCLKALKECIIDELITKKGMVSISESIGGVGGFQRFQRGVKSKLVGFDRVRSSLTLILFSFTFAGVVLALIFVIGNERGSGQPNAGKCLCSCCSPFTLLWKLVWIFVIILWASMVLLSDFCLEAKPVTEHLAESSDPTVYFYLYCTYERGLKHPYLKETNNLISAAAEAHDGLGMLASTMSTSGASDISKVEMLQRLSRGALKESLYLNASNSTMDCKNIGLEVDKAFIKTCGGKHIARPNGVELFFPRSGGQFFLEELWYIWFASLCLACVSSAGKLYLMCAFVLI